MCWSLTARGRPTAVPRPGKPYALALIHTAGLEFAGWEIHPTECDHVTKSMQRGSFVAIVSAESPGAFVKSETAARAEQSLGDEDYKIMPCWADTDKQSSESTQPRVVLSNAYGLHSLNRSTFAPSISLFLNPY